MSNARAKARPDLPAGLQVFGEYVIDQPIDEGPIWTVYRALHVTRQGERFYLWSMKASMSGNPNLVEGFARQARLLERLSHKGITPVLTTGVDQGVILMVTPETRGQSLRAALDAAGGKLPPPEVARIVREAAEVLDYLHNHRPQIVHRALEPSKILLVEPDQHVKLLEVGYAHALLEAKVEPVEELPRAPDGYRAPEDVAGQPVGAPVDQYSLACIAFEALTGKPVSAAGTLPKDVIHPSVEAVLTRARSATVLGRYASAGAFADALARAIAVTSKAQPTAPRPPLPTATATGTTAGATAGTTTGASTTPAASAPKPPAGPGVRRSATLLGPGTGGPAPASVPGAVNPPTTQEAVTRPTDAVTRPAPAAAPAPPTPGKTGFHQRRGTLVGVGAAPPTPAQLEPGAGSGALDGAIEIFGEDIPVPASLKGNIMPQSGGTARFATLSATGEPATKPPAAAQAIGPNIAPNIAPGIAKHVAPNIAPAPAASAGETLEADDVDILVDETATFEESSAPEESAAASEEAPPPLPYSVGAPPGVPTPIAPNAPSLAPPPLTAAEPAPAPAPAAVSAPTDTTQPVPTSSTSAPTGPVSAPDTVPSPPPWPTAASTIPARETHGRGARKRSVVLPALGTLIVLGLLGAGGAYYAGLLKLPPEITAYLPPPPASTESESTGPSAPEPGTPQHAPAHAARAHGHAPASAHETPATTATNHAVATAPANANATPDASRASANANANANANATADAGHVAAEAAARDAGAPTVTVAPPQPTVATAPPPAPVAPPPASPTPPPATRRGGRLPQTPNANDRNAVVAEVQRRVDACNGHMGRHARMVVRYDASGHVTQIIWAGNLFTNRPIGACIEAALRAVPYPPFSRPIWETDYRFYVR